MLMGMGIGDCGLGIGDWAQYTNNNNQKPNRKAHIKNQIIFIKVYKLNKFQI